MFDPTIYSLQPLQVSNNVMDSGEKKNQATSDQDTNSDEYNTSSEQNADDKVELKQDTDDSSKQQHTDSTDEHTVSTLSRKTSTASDVYSSMSDYTPENTVTSSTTSSPPTVSILQNILPHDEPSDSVQVDSVTTSQTVSPVNVQNPTDTGITNEQSPSAGPASLNANEVPANTNTEQSSDPSGASEPSESINQQMAQVDSLLKDAEALGEADKIIKPQPIRKISRFLVSPAILSVDAASLPKIQSGNNSVLIEAIEPSSPFTPSELTLSLAAVNETETLSTVLPPGHPVANAQNQPMTIEQQVQYIGSSLANQSVLNYVVDPNGEGISVYDPNNANLQNNPVATTPQNPKPLGPEHINTLEQLKIGLENITHAHVTTKLKEPSSQDGSIVVGNAQQPILGTNQMQYSDGTPIMQTGHPQGQQNLIYSTRRTSDDISQEAAIQLTTLNDQQQLMMQMQQQQSQQLQPQQFLQQEMPQQMVQQINNQMVVPASNALVQSSAPTTMISVQSSIAEALNLDLNNRKLSQQASLETTNEM